MDESVSLVIPTTCEKDPSIHPIDVVVEAKKSVPFPIFADGCPRAGMCGTDGADTH
jgi:hypothetical protein